MKIAEIDFKSEQIVGILSLSLEWEKEHITYGYVHNDLSSLRGKRIFVATDNGDVIAYLFGTEKLAGNMSAVIPDGRKVFDVDELYVVKGFRSKGIGKLLFKYVEQIVRAESVEYITLNTATKNYKAILHFYIDEMDMDFWSAELYKKLV